MAKTSLIPSVWEVPQAIRNRLGERAGRQRLIAEEGHLLLVLHKPAAPGQPDREAALFWRKPDGSWLSDQTGSGIASLENHLDQYLSAIDEAEQQEARANNAREYFSVLDSIAPVHRSADNMYQVLQEARKAMSSDRALIDQRDRAYDIARRAELLYNGTKNSLDFAVAVRAEQQAISSQHMAVASHRLNLLAAFFFPVATLASILGVNLTFPFREETSLLPFVVFLGAGLLSGAILCLALFSRPKEQS